MSADSFQIFDQLIGWNLRSICPIDQSVTSKSSIIAGAVVLELNKPSVPQETTKNLFLSIQCSGTDESQSIRFDVLNGTPQNMNEPDSQSAAELKRRLLAPSPFRLAMAELFTHQFTTDSGIRASKGEIVITSQMAINFSIMCGPCPDEVTLVLDHNYSGFTDYSISRLSKSGGLSDG